MHQWVRGGLVKMDFITHSKIQEPGASVGAWCVVKNGGYSPLGLSSELSLDSESKLEPSLAILLNMQ